MSYGIGLNRLLNLSDKGIDGLFVVIMLAGSAVILASFYFLGVNSLLDQANHTVKAIIIVIGFTIMVTHVMLTYFIRSVFQSLQKTKKELDQKNDELKKIDEAKTEFVAMVTHELKTPMVPIVGYANMLLQQRYGPVNDTQREKIRAILSGAESLQGLIQDILDLHKSDLGKLKMNMEIEDMGEIVQEAISITFPLANRRGVILDNMISQSIKIKMDKRRILQVITNLIKNAIDFVPLEEGVIQINQNIQGGNLILSISDNGQGMSKEKIGNLFRKFYQTNTSTTGGRDGTGLGLSICKVIVEQHGGRIWAESELGKGTEIKLSLPILSLSEENSILQVQQSN
jgi:signal transduction histidine kinase